VLVILIRGIFLSMPLRWTTMTHIHTNSRDDQFRHSSNIKGITSTIWEAIVLVVLMRGDF
jgi:hypothetical protein